MSLLRGERVGESLDREEWCEREGEKNWGLHELVKDAGVESRVGPDKNLLIVRKSEELKRDGGWKTRCWLEVEKGERNPS